MKRVHVASRLGAAMAAIFALAACSGADTASEEQEAAPAAAAESDETQVALPEANAAAVWDYLNAVDFRESWELWPEKGEKYEGQEPHGALLTTYLSADALAALTGQAGVLPTGSMVVKDNFMPDGMLGATTVMYKVEGYNSDNNDWWFAKFMPDGSLDVMPNGMEMEGQLPGCTNCHGAMRGNDFLFTGSLGG